MDTFDPDKLKDKALKDVLILSIKKLIRWAVPEFPINVIDDLIKIISDGKADSFKVLLDQISEKP